MSNLVLELRQGEVMIVNGAPIRFRTRSRIELTAKARFLFGKQIMPPDQVDSPAAASTSHFSQPILATKRNGRADLNRRAISSPSSSRQQHPTSSA